MLTLRSFCKCDAETILSWTHSERAFRLWSADTYKDYPAKPEDINSRYDEIENNHKGLVYPLMAVDGNEVIGHLIMRVVDEDNHVVRFGYIIVDSAKRGKGYGSRMLNVAIDYAKEQLGAKKITLGVFENNPSARRCYESVGFVPCGGNEYSIMGEVWNCPEMEYVVK